MICLNAASFWISREELQPFFGPQTEQHNTNRYPRLWKWLANDRMILNSCWTQIEWIAGNKVHTWFHFNWIMKRNNKKDFPKIKRYCLHFVPVKSSMTFILSYTHWTFSFMSIEKMLSVTWDYREDDVTLCFWNSSNSFFRLMMIDMKQFTETNRKIKSLSIKILTH